MRNIKIILSSLFLLISLNIYSQVYNYTSNTLKIQNKEKAELILLESPWFFNLNLDKKILTVKHNKEVFRYKITNYYKYTDEDDIYIHLKNIYNSKNKFRISVNHKDKYIKYYLNEGNKLKFMINTITKVK